MKPAIYVALALLSVACSSTQTPRTRESGRTDGFGTTVKGSELGPNLLHTLRSRVPSMSVSESAGQCPGVHFRGQGTLNVPRPPSIYVDGSLMLDTCILDQISTMDIDFVEVYPSGITTRPGVQRNPSGVIYIQRVRE